MAERRDVPSELHDAWRDATKHPDPLEALIAARQLEHELTQWQGQLVSEALAAGATWEMIGDALGITRQAVWRRFHADVDDLKIHYRAEAERLRRKAEHDARRAARDAMRRARRDR